MQWRLAASIKKYGFDNHLFEIVKLCEINELNKWERYFQDLYQCISKNGLNCKLTNASDKKVVHCEETRLKISIANKGRQVPQYQIDKCVARTRGLKRTEEFKSVLSSSRMGKNNPMFGKTIKESSKQLQRNKLSGQLNYLSKLIINLETGIFYECLREASESCNMKKGVLWAEIVRYKKNKTPFRYA